MMIVKNNKIHSMKTKLTLLFLAVACIAMAQKKEMKKIEKAIKANDSSKAIELFNSIDVSTLEPEYEGAYSFYKAVTLVGISGESNASEQDVYESFNLIEKAEKLGYDEKDLIAVLQSKAKIRLFSLANEKLQSNDIEAAFTMVSYLSDKDPSNMGMYFDAANMAYQAGKFEIAKEKYQNLLDKKYTGEQVAYLALNKSTGQQEGFPSKILRDLAITSGSHANPMEDRTSSQVGSMVTNLVWMHKNDGNEARATSVLEKALKDFSNDQSLKFALADIYLILEMIEEYKAATKSLTEEVKDPKVYDKLALAALKTKDYDQAINYYETSIGLEPINFVAQANLGLSYIEKGNLEATSAQDQLELYKKAIACYEKALSIEAENTLTINTLISLYGVFNMSDKVAEMKAKL